MGTIGRHWGALALALVAAGCGDDVSLGTVGAMDAGAGAGLDAGAADAGGPDAGARDAGPPDAGPPRAVGAGCEVDSNCAGGADAVCLRLEIEISVGPSITVDFSAGGYCTRVCNDTDRPCPAGSVCSPEGPVERYCIDQCNDGMGPCRTAEGYSCQTVDSEMVCVPPLML